MAPLSNQNQNIKKNLRKKTPVDENEVFAFYTKYSFNETISEFKTGHSCLKQSQHTHTHRRGFNFASGCALRYILPYNNRESTIEMALCARVHSTLKYIVKTDCARFMCAHS